MAICRAAEALVRQLNRLWVLETKWKCWAKKSQASYGEPGSGICGRTRTVVINRMQFIISLSPSQQQTREEVRD